ncbi:hypothetical protein AcW1_009707 [Taiwanofungus camphoratus]|nr:hypothetical protein AcW1_009707 [Antrodia cinnamomea]
MATLTRAVPPTATEREAEYLPHKWQRTDLRTGVPTPFPSASEQEQADLLEELEKEELLLHAQDSSTSGNPFCVRRVQSAEAGTSRQQAHYEPDVTDTLPSSAEHIEEEEQQGNAMSEELMPSIVNVQKSCLTTLNDLLSSSPNWRPIVPDRRHSMPPRSPTSPVIAVQSSSALQTLLLNLRAQDAGGTQMCERSPPVETSDDGVLISELLSRINSLADTNALFPHDAALARTLAGLIAHFHRLISLHPPARSSASPRTASWASASGSTFSPATSPSQGDSFVRLRRQLSDFKLAREGADSAVRAHGEFSAANTSSPVVQVETALLWARVDEELERVLVLCREHAAEPDTYSLPPEYDTAWYPGSSEGKEEELPEYQHDVNRSSTTDAKMTLSIDTGAAEASSTAVRNTGTLNEKMRMDLETVVLAIDRLYLVAPQLHDQRVELKKSKIEQMEKARLWGLRRVREGKQRAREGKEVWELERMVDLIGKASNRKMVDQAVVLEGGLDAQLERARQRDLKKREAFVEQLVNHSDAGRLHSQDAVLTASDTTRLRVKDPDALLSLPEFIREAVPEGVELKMQMADPKAMLSLPEFVKEPVPKGMGPLSPSRSKSLKGVRSRSMSAPPLAWLLASSSRPSSPIPVSTSDSKKVRGGKVRRVGSSTGWVPTLQAGLEVNYVAEYHESLHHILVFLTASGMKPGVDLEAEVVSPSEIPGAGNDGCEYLVLRCGLVTSSFLRLPARVSPGKKEVKVDGQYYQIKLPASPSSQVEGSSNGHITSHTALLDATQLSSARPSSFICTSCSLPLVQSSQLRNYQDLPSEHWAELVDAWMCHSDQKLHEHVTKHSSEGFWPTEGHALVGGSYLLLDGSAVVEHNLWPADQEERKLADDWRRVRCICGAVIGRCQERNIKGLPLSPVYRLAKYAIRPVSSTTEPFRLPLSAFIAEDMSEYVHAHATYRFVVFDEEEERPRILIWLFKPSMQIAYTAPTEYAIPKSGSVHAAKVLYKILGPSAAHSDLQMISNRYPGFPQAEHLFYPLDICRRLAGLLNESNTAYPESMRTMTGLDVGWLQRA